MIHLELDSIFSDELADPVLYNSGTGAVSVSGIVDLGSDGSVTGGKPGSQASILVQKSEVPAPEYRHTFTIAGAVWYVTPEEGKNFILEETSATYLLRIQKDERVSAWRT